MYMCNIIHNINCTSIIYNVNLCVMHAQSCIQIPLIFLQKMDLLLKKTPQDEVKRHILPMILASLETEHRQVQVSAIFIIVTHCMGIGGVGRISDMAGQIIFIEANARVARENISYRKSRPLIKRPLTPNPFTD